MSKEFSNKYLEEATKYNDLAMKAQGADKKKYAEEASMFNKIASSLLDINFKEKIRKKQNIYFMMITF